MNKLAPFFLAAALALPGVAFADAPATDAGARSGHSRGHSEAARGRHGRSRHRMAERLELTDAQAQAMRESLRALRAEARAVRALPAASAERAQARADLRTRRAAMIDAVLTPAQRQMRDAARAARATTREGRGPRETGVRRVHVAR